MAITPFTNIPQTSDPTNFAPRADDFLAVQLPRFVTEANAQASALTLNATTDTSATSNSIGLGAKTFTVTAGKSFQPGMYLVIADTAAPSTNSMGVQVTSYSGTSLVTNCVSFTGSGTKTAWVISQSANFTPLDNSVTTVKIADASITQAKLAANVAGNGPAFSAYRSTVQSIPNSTNTKLQCQSEEYDTNNEYDSATNYRFQPSIAGYYQVNGQFQLATGGTNVFCLIYKNGATFKRGVHNIAATNVLISGSVSAVVYLNGSTDYIELYVFQISGAAINTNATADTNYFQASLVRAA